MLFDLSNRICIHFSFESYFIFSGIFFLFYVWREWTRLQV